MASHEANSKASKWFSNKNLRLSLQKRLGRSKSDNSTTLCSPRSPQTPRTPIVNREEELQKVFQHFDSDGDGKVSALELRSYFASIGEYISHEEAQAAIDDLDTDGDKSLDFDDFSKLMKNHQDNDDLKLAFEMFELEKGSGCITPKGLQKMLQKLGDKKSLNECAAMIHVFDVDGNGVLDFNEFHQMMMAN